MLQVKCITFGSPAAGNEALVDHVKGANWDSHFHHVALAGGLGELGVASSYIQIDVLGEPGPGVIGI